MNYIDAGFNYFILNAATPGLPQNVRQGWLRRFKTEVAPLIERTIASQNEQLRVMRA
jgi:hypothetical protein